MTEGNDATVLIIENNHSLSEALVNILRGQGYKTLAAPDFDTALEMFNAEHPSLVLCELKIGNRDAFEFMDKAKASKDGAHSPFILMSPTKDPKVVLKAAKAGVADFMVKPFSPEVLIGKLSKALTRKAAVHKTSAADKYIAAGKQCLEQKRLQDALTLFAKAAQVDHESAEAFSNLAEICHIKRDMDQYGKMALKAAELHARQDHFERAQEIFEQLRRQDPEAPNPFKAIARDLEAKGDLEGAARNYQKATLSDPKDVDLYVGMSEILSKLGNQEAAAQSAVAALKLEDDNQQARQLFRDASGSKWTDHPESLAGKKRAEEDEKRGSVRFWIPDLMAEFKGRKDHATLIEMSVNRIGFSLTREPFNEGEQLNLVIMRIEEGQPKKLIKKLKARVARIDEESVACVFEDITEEQRQELRDLIKAAQETQRELKREEMKKNKDISFEIDMLFL